ncbi:MAG: SDR family oxidoreductase [Bacteroidota bacterium]
MKQVILITGDSRGIGKSLCEHFCSRGFFVFGCSRSETGFSHPDYVHIVADITKEDDVKKVVRRCLDERQRIDILINNAGIASMNHLVSTPASTAINLFETNFLGTFLFSREVSKAMIKNKYGRIVNFTTVARPLNLEGELVYASTKAAVEQFTKVAAKELGSFNITVNAIGPTPVATGLTKTVPKEKLDKIINSQAIKRMGTFSDIHHVVDFLVDPKSDFISGQVIYLGGINS